MSNLKSDAPAGPAADPFTEGKRLVREEQRRHMREKAVIGSWWIRRSDRCVFQVRNVWRADRRAQLAPDFGGDPVTVTFDELRRDYEWVAL